MKQVRRFKERHFQLVREAKRISASDLAKGLVRLREGLAGLRGLLRISKPFIKARNTELRKKMRRLGKHPYILNEFNGSEKITVVRSTAVEILALQPAFNKIVAAIENANPDPKKRIRKWTKQALKLIAEMRGRAGKVEIRGLRRLTLDIAYTAEAFGFSERRQVNRWVQELRLFMGLLEELSQADAAVLLKEKRKSLGKSLKRVQRSRHEKIQQVLNAGEKVFLRRGVLDA